MIPWISLRLYHGFFLHRVLFRFHLNFLSAVRLRLNHYGFAELAVRHR
ncbi:MAG: hypothetical protein ACSHX9_12630 [Luteolibacter sp.]